jgi:hypothetical protein
MATEVFAYPEEHTRLLADIISHGIEALRDDPRLSDDIVEGIKDHLEGMYLYAAMMENGDDVFECNTCGRRGNRDDGINYHGEECPAEDCDGIVQLIEAQS